jgi:hypothetical protein
VIFNDVEQNKTTELLIADLEDPLNGPLGLWGEYMSIISMGYAKEKNPKNTDKCHIQLVPWFLIPKDFDMTAQHLKPIMEKSDAEKPPVCMFQIWDKGEEIEYKTTQETLCRKIHSWEAYWSSLRVWVYESIQITYDRLGYMRVLINRWEEQIAYQN